MFLHCPTTPPAGADSFGGPAIRLAGKGAVPRSGEASEGRAGK
jgi:hypothetical protein